MNVRTAAAALVLAACTQAGHASTLVFDSPSYTPGVYRYNLLQITPLQSFNVGDKFIFSNLSGVTGANSLYAPSLVSVSTTNTSATFTVVEAFSYGDGTDSSSNAVYQMFEVRSTSLRLGNISYVIPGSAPSFGITQGPVATAAVTPEPSSLLLLSTGALGLWSMTRRRRLQA